MNTMTAEQALEAAKGMTFETVWAALTKTDAQMQESHQRTEEAFQRMEKTVAELSKGNEETRKILDETAKTVADMSKGNEETRKIVDETAKTVADMSKGNEETRKIVDETAKTVASMSKNLGGLGNLQGRLTEAMFTVDLWKKFNEAGFVFTKQSPHVKFVENKQVIAEVDVFLENGEYAMLVEIKTDLTIGDIDDHVKRIAKIRQYMDAHADSRKLVAAVAGEIVHENVMFYAHKKGMFVLMQSGDSVSIAATPHGFTLQEFTAA